MLMFKIVGCGQLILLFALMGLSSASIISWVIAATFLLVFFLTCASISATRMQYDGLFGSVLYGFALWILPISLLLIAFMPQVSITLFTAAALSLLAERTREIKSGQCQLGWIALPLLSVAVAIYAQTSSLASSLNVLSSVASICTTGLFFFRSASLTHPAVELTLLQHRRRLRSIGRAA
jgi:hypothetical protein